MGLFNLLQIFIVMRTKIIITEGQYKRLKKNLSEGALHTTIVKQMKELRDKDALVIDEDNLLRPNEQLNKLRIGTKASLVKNDVMQFDYTFKAKIVEDDDTNESNLPKSSK